MNPATLLGGAAIYCVDAANQPAAHYTGGGIRILEAEGLPMGGAELLFVPDTRIDEVGIPVTNTILGEGIGPYGSMQLYRLTTGEFSLIGYEEPGKQFQFIWRECTPVNGIPVANTIPTATLVEESNVTPTPSPTTAPTAIPTATPTDVQGCGVSPAFLNDPRVLC